MRKLSRTHILVFKAFKYILEDIQVKSNEKDNITSMQFL